MKPRITTLEKEYQKYVAAYDEGLKKGHILYKKNFYGDIGPSAKRSFERFCEDAEIAAQSSDGRFSRSINGFGEYYYKEFNRGWRTQKQLTHLQDQFQKKYQEWKELDAAAEKMYQDALAKWEASGRKGRKPTKPETMFDKKDRYGREIVPDENLGGLWQQFWQEIENTPNALTADGRLRQEFIKNNFSKVFWAFASVNATIADS